MHGEVLYSILWLESNLCQLVTYVHPSEANVGSNSTELYIRRKQKTVLSAPLLSNLITSRVALGNVDLGEIAVLTKWTPLRARPGRKLR